jgi:arylsulfatase A-like enzyme
VEYVCQAGFVNKIPVFRYPKFCAIATFTIMMRLVNRRKFLASSVGLLASTRLWSQQHAAGTKPNILYIMADDLGWADLSCYGRKEYQTPNLDSLARNGVRFTNAYSASSLCTPTRVGFNTGRYPARVPIGLTEPLAFKKNLKVDVGLGPGHPTIASLLKGNGYETILVGKWHLGYLPNYSPIKSGFDDFFGIMSGGADYFTHKDSTGEPDLFEDEVPVEKVGYITDLLTDRAIQFVTKKHEKPFFVSLNYTAPHWPWEGPDDEEKSKTLKRWLTDGGSAEVYGRMMKSLDDGIGRVLEALRKSKLERNTLVLFTSDNGGERFSYNWPFSGAKYDLLEGGIRVPAIAFWKGVIPKGIVTDQAATSMDWTKTFLALSGTSEDPSYPMDGVDLLPVMTGKQPAFERKLFWRMRNQDAMRSGQWKYYKKKEASTETEFLFDLKFDQMEKTDFKEEKPEIFQQLKAEFEMWNGGMLKYS